MENNKTKWEDISLGEFLLIQSILKSNISEEMKIVNILSLLMNESVDDIKKCNLMEANKLSSTLKFLSEELPKVEYKNEYTLNGREYTLNADVTKISTAQYIDFQNYIKVEEGESIDLTKLLSVWLVPKDHDYGDGYNIEQVYKDIETICILDANAINFFLQQQFTILTALILDYSTRDNLKKMEMSQEKIDEIMKPLDEVDLISTESYHSL